MSDTSATTTTITTSAATTTTSVVGSSSVQPKASVAAGVGSQTALSLSTSTCTAAAIADAFDIFDHSGNRTIDVRELGTVLRYLGKKERETDRQKKRHRYA